VRNIIPLDLPSGQDLGKQHQKISSGLGGRESCLQHYLRLVYPNFQRTILFLQSFFVEKTMFKPVAEAPTLLISSTLRRAGGKVDGAAATITVVVVSFPDVIDDATGKRSEG
jgi:hypothetical protein